MNFGKELVIDAQKTMKDAVLVLIIDFGAPFDYILVEGDIRMMKLKKKISGCYRTQQVSNIFCAIRGNISTAIKKFMVLNLFYLGRLMVNFLTPTFSSD